MKKPNNKNALSHGIYARDFVLPWESEDDYMKHYQEIRDHYEPVGPPQEQVVRDLAQLFWKKRRLNISSQLAYAQHPNAPAMAEAGRGGWEGLGQYLQKTSGDTARLSIDARKAAQASSSTLVFLSQMIQSKILEQSVSPPPTEPEPTEAEQKARTESLAPQYIRTGSGIGGVLLSTVSRRKHCKQYGERFGALTPVSASRRLAKLRKIECAAARSANAGEQDRDHNVAVCRRA